MIWASETINRDWSRKFAWLPVTATAGESTCTFWLEFYEERDLDCASSEIRLAGKVVGQCHQGH